MEEFLQSLSTCGWLVWRDIRAALTDFVANIVDSAIFPIGWLFVDGYIMPYLGVPADYGVFMIAGLAAGMCLNSTGKDAGDLITDLEGPRAISYELSLPLPSWMLCMKFALTYAIRGVILNILIFPIGALMLWEHINLITISWGKFFLLFWWINLLYGYFSLVVALWASTTDGYWRFWLRWGWLLFLVAGFQFSWKIMERAVPKFAYINLLNPLLYSFEGIRAALLGQEGFIDYWVCLWVTIVYTAIFGVLALWLFKKRLDCV